MLAALQAFFENHRVLCCYLTVINAFTFVMFVADKVKAIRGSFRIREGVLLGLCAIGGAAGGFLAMIIARHKIRVPAFTAGVPILIVVWILLILFGIQVIQF